MFSNENTMMIINIGTFLLAFTSTNAFPDPNSKSELEVVASWRLATFAPPPGFPGAAPSGYPLYAPNALFTGVQVTQEKIFLSFPRFQPGQPITLGWVPQPPPGHNLLLDTPINAFPDWDWHRAAANGPESASTNCSALVSVFNTKLDRCGRLWVLDSGVSETFLSLSASCPAKLLAFDTTTGEELYRYEFGSEVLRSNSLFTHFALDDRSPQGSSCFSIPRDLFVYIADTEAPGIIVFDVQKCQAWRHDPSQAYPDPDWGVYTIAGESFTLMDGILGITLSNPIVQPVHGSNVYYSERILYFQALASDRIYGVATSALRAQPTPNECLPIKIIGYRSSQSAPLILDPSDGSLIFSPVSETSIASFQPETNTLTVKAFNADLLQGVTDVYVEPEQIWAISTRIQKYFRFTVTAEQVNLRILRLRRTPPPPYY